MLWKAGIEPGLDACDACRSRGVDSLIQIPTCAALQYLHLPQQQAAKKMAISTTILKKVCRVPVYATAMCDAQTVVDGSWAAGARQTDRSPTAPALHELCRQPSTLEWIIGPSVRSTAQYEQGAE